MHFNEPLSFLQRLSEDIQYHSLLTRAAKRDLDNSSQRAALVAAFVISHYSSTHQRTTKPFNPLLGETYEFVNDDIAVIAEQVQHHPPVSALHVRGDGWCYYTAHEIRNRFLGNSMEVWPVGNVHIVFDNGEHFVYQQAHTFVHNIILGELWLDNAGIITINEVTHHRYTASIKMKRSSFLFKEAKQLGDVSARVVSGGTYSKSAKPLHKLSGNWTSHLKLDNALIWTCTPSPGTENTGGYHMGAWAWNLNANAVDKSAVAKTDSRLRPDQRALEAGGYRIAAQEKERLETAQRKRRRDLQQEYEPKWFEVAWNQSTGRNEWRYKGGYFEQKVAGGEGWPADVADIF